MSDFLLKSKFLAIEILFFFNFKLYRALFIVGILECSGSLVKLHFYRILPLSGVPDHRALEWMQMRASCSMKAQLTAGCYIFSLSTGLIGFLGEGGGGIMGNQKGM